MSVHLDIAADQFIFCEDNELHLYCIEGFMDSRYTPYRDLILGILKELQVS